MSLRALESAGIFSNEDPFSDYETHCHDLGLSRVNLRLRLRAARIFLERHPDLSAWTARPLEARLTDIARIERSWPFIGWALVTGRCHAEVDFLAAKNLGHSIAQATFHIYADDLTRLRAAASRLAMTDVWSNTVLCNMLPLTVAFFGRSVATVTDDELEQFRASLAATPMLTGSAKRNVLGHLHGLHRLLYEAAMTDVPVQRRRSDGPISRATQLCKVGAPEIRRTIIAYLDARASVLRPSTMANLTSNLAIFGEFLTDRYPELTSLTRLERSQVEAFFSWSSTRTWRGRFTDRPVGPWPVTEAVITLRSFFEDIAAWGWAEAPPRRLIFSTDVPRPPHPLPRALSPDVDLALMAAVADLEDTYARVAITVMRHTGIRIGELLDLEMDCVVDYGSAGRWLRVPLGKLNTERSVPLDAAAQDALEEWLARRPYQRPVPHPRSGTAVEFVFMEGGRRLHAHAIQHGLAQAVDVAHLRGRDGGPLRVTAHQLRHTFATELVNAGMSLQALMALLGHSTAEMTMRYATLASPTLKSAYDAAMGKIRPRIPLVPAGRPAVPDKVEWLAQEMLKTRVAHGYCAREFVAEACPYANVCESCANFITTPEFAPVLESQLADVQRLRDDAERRGWESEVARHDRVITSLRGHLRRFDRPPQP